MDYSRILLIPFQPTSLVLVIVFSALITFLGSAGMYGILSTLFLQIWVLKYGYVIIEHIADGAPEPPVMSTDMLSPFEIRPWLQLGLVVGVGSLCYSIGGTAGGIIAACFALLLPASVAALGMGEPVYQAANPVALLRIAIGMGPWYLAILASLLVYAFVYTTAQRLGVWSLFVHALDLFCEISFFSLIGGAVFLRRRQLGFEPSRSPERAAERAEAERTKLRAKMLDDVFQQVRIGKYIDATAPLAHWLRDLDNETAVRDACFVADRALDWNNNAGLNTIGSTLIRHLLRAGRPDIALRIFETLRARSPTLTLDSAPDLRVLIEYAESVGRDELAAAMRLETPVFKPRA